MAVRHLLIANDKKWDMLYAKRAFVHWIVGEGIDEEDMDLGRIYSREVCLDMRDV